MRGKKRKPKSSAARHRGRIQAQGGGVEKSVSWSRQTPPTESEMMAMVEQLEAKLTAAEKRERAVAFEQLRRRIRSAAAQQHGLSPLRASYPHEPFGGIRVDLEVITGLAGIPDSKNE